MIVDSILNVLARRSMERPGTPLSDPDGWLCEVFGGRSSAGVKVNRKTALSYAAVWRAVHLISNGVGKLPLVVHRRLPEGGKDRARLHPAYRLLHRKPNADMTALVFRRTLQAHVLLHGNAYAYISRLGDGSPAELIPLVPHETWPVRVNRQLWYVTTVHWEGGGTEQRKLDPSNVLHVKGLGYDGLCGYSVLEMARDSLGLGIAASKYQSKFFSNNAEPRVIIEHPGDMTVPAQRAFLEQWNAMHQGLDNAHKTAILTKGAKVNPFSMRAKDAQLLEARQFEIREVANWFGLPPHKLGDSSRVSYNSLEQENYAYLDDSLDPHLCAWEQECDAKLLTEDEQESEEINCEFVREAIARTDTATKSKTLIEEINNGVLTLNEGRAIRNLPPAKNGKGDQYRMPANIVIVGEKPAAPPTGDSPPKPDPTEPPGGTGGNGGPAGDTDEGGGDRSRVAAAARAVCLDAGRRACKRLANEARRAAGKPATFLRWLDELQGERRAVVEMLAPAASLAAAIDGRDAAQRSAAIAGEFLAAFRQKLLDLSGQARADQLAQRVADEMAIFESHGPDQVVEALTHS